LRTSPARCLACSLSLHDALPIFTGVGLNWTGTATVCSLLTPVFLMTLVFALLLSFPVAKRIQPKNDTATLIGALVLLVLCMFNLDRKSTRLNSSHVSISYAVFCL